MPTREILLSLIALLAGIGASSCVEGATCTPADTTHSCCVKNHPQEPEACDGVERMEGATFRIATTNHSTTSSGKILTATTAVAVKTEAEEVLVTMSDAAQAKKLQETLDKEMEECADLAEQTVDSRRPKDEILDSAKCNEEVGRDDDGKPETRAMQLGKEKHEEASRCIEERLRKLIAGYFSIEQRYRYDMATGKLEPISPKEEQGLIRQGRKHELKGTLKPDVVIHSGKPTQVRFVYDFKFPCVKNSLPTWNVYKQGPYRDNTQGQIYKKAFGVRPGRVVPGRKGVIR